MSEMRNQVEEELLQLWCEYTGGHLGGSEFQDMVCAIIADKILAKESKRTQPEAASIRDAIIEECADLADRKLDCLSSTECSYICDVAEAIRALKASRRPQLPTPSGEKDA